MDKRISITKRRVILTEGDEDVAFLEMLLGEHAGEYDIKKSKNVDTIGKELRNLQKDPGYRDVTHLCVICDSDVDHDKRIATIRDWFKSIGLDVQDCGVWTDDGPKAAYCTMPVDGPGVLETVLLNAYSDGDSSCAETFAECIGQPEAAKGNFWVEKLRMKSIPPRYGKLPGPLRNIMKRDRFRGSDNTIQAIESMILTGL